MRGAPESPTPLQRLSADDAFANKKANPLVHWPRLDSPDNRFAGYADPGFAPGFQLTPGQTIFTIGSCFARNIERVLAEKGFDIPMQRFAVAHSDWAAGHSNALLNNYVPPAILPPIRWAFGRERFDPTLHCIEMRPGRYLDLYLTTSTLRPLPLEQILARREEISALYRHLATSGVVVITLGYIEAWFDHSAKRYLNGAPPKSAIAREPQRFEVQVLSYQQVVEALEEVVALLDQVCPVGYRIILTVSPVPISSTFTTQDVAVANMYSKSVLRAATGALCARHSHIDYFPSYESVMLSTRELAYVDDQVHVTPELVRFNVDRMLRAYLAQEAGGSVAQALEAAKAARHERNFGGALKILQQCWHDNKDDSELTCTLAKAHFENGAATTAERLLSDYCERHDDARALLMLAEHFIAGGRYEEAAALAERAGALKVFKLHTVMIRAQAYFHLERYEEGLRLVQRACQFQLGGRRPDFVYWLAQFLEKTGDDAGAEEAYRNCNAGRENIDFMTRFAMFLASRGRAGEAQGWCEKALALDPNHAETLRIRRSLSKHGPAPVGGRAEPALLARLRGLFGG